MKHEYDFSKGGRGKFFREGAKLHLPACDEQSDWAGPSGQIGEFIVRETEKSLNAYREQPKLITEHVRVEQDTVQGGYAHRQLLELVQNSADTLLDSPKGKSIVIRLTEHFLYCADDGIPIDEDGIEGLMFDRMSSKRSTAAIGRFGRGFKSVLGVTDAPEFYSRSGSFRFDKNRAAERIAQAVSSERYPVLRLPEPIDPHEEWSRDEDLRELMSWATNVVRLPLKTGAFGDLAQQIRDFPPEFLLFVDHIRYLTLEDGEHSREFILHRRDGELLLNAENSHSRWLRFDTTHHLSDKARADWHLYDENEDVPIQWAVPLDRLTRPGHSHFWAFFPTSTASLVPGILNAPWKTNEDRQNLLSGPYNQELIEAAAKMIAANLPGLATQTDPALHLDALPRESQAGDSVQVDLLRKHLFINLHGHEVIPDQCGNLRIATKIKYPPKELTVDRQEDMAPFARWKAYPGRPTNWLHHRALTRNRLARIDRLFDPEGKSPRWPASGAKRTKIAEWLEALVEGQQPCDIMGASMAAVQTAALIPLTRSGEHFGDIVLTVTGSLVEPDPDHLFLPSDSSGGQPANSEYCVHQSLVSDSNTFSALQKLGIKPPSPKSRFRAVAGRILEQNSDQVVREDVKLYEGANLYKEFWFASRRLSIEDVKDILREYEDRNKANKLRVRTQAETWVPLRFVMLPGNIVPGDGSRDDDATVDTQFHQPDDRLLRDLGVSDAPGDDCDLSMEPSFRKYQEYCRNRFTSRDLKRNPHSYMLNFKTSVGCGPLHILTSLSDEGRAAYTDALLSLNAIFSRWTMRHKTQDVYPELPCDSLSIDVLRKEGRIQTASGAIVPFADALGLTPKNLDALNTLLAHPMADKIKVAFDLAEPIPEIFGEGDAIPLTDVWPGLRDYLPVHQKLCNIVSCEQIHVAGQARECVFHASDIYLAGVVEEDEQHKLKLIAYELELGLSPMQVSEIIQRKTPQEIEERRSMIRQYLTDAERLLAAVGEQQLREELPDSLLAVLEKDGTMLTGAEIAEAAIATYHTDALKQYKGALSSLAPPSHWAGSARAIEFVRSLGFSTEWAGERYHRLEPFLEIEGRYRLPDLHPYQKTVVRNVREMLGGSHSASTPRRGMISMPTGSGKTRVAVQAIVEAMNDGFGGGILWVADRSELCEQAVEAWRQVWSSIGAHGARLRISRVWGGQQRPLPVIDPHVVVATIQTLHAKLSGPHSDYDFLKDFGLVVFDEAHRSIAPTFTSVMDEIGLTRRQGTGEPFLIGLTATPYRGYNEEETLWLANRYSGNRLDVGAFENEDAQDIVQELQSSRVLAQADHKVIEGETFSLEDILGDSAHSHDWKQELEKWRSLPWLPQSVENRIAESAERTRRIIEAYRTHIDPDWPVLIFATSVEHAQTVATLINRSGIRSRAVSGGTEKVTRRRIVEEFRRGKIKALVNYGVFREGFDAPKTRAIIVARPVYSPNLYFQMIGRGLRGALNGGNERCLILNVRDNIEQFDRSLAFSELDWLWA